MTEMQIFVLGLVTGSAIGLYVGVIGSDNNG